MSTTQCGKRQECSQLANSTSRRLRVPSPEMEFGRVPEPPTTARKTQCQFQRKVRDTRLSAPYLYVSFVQNESRDCRFVFLHTTTRRRTYPDPVQHEDAAQKSFAYIITLYSYRRIVWSRSVARRCGRICARESSNIVAGACTGCVTFR